MPEPQPVVASPTTVVSPVKEMTEAEKDAALTRLATVPLSAGPPPITLADCYSRSTNISQHLQVIYQLLDWLTPKVEERGRDSKAWKLFDELIQAFNVGFATLGHKIFVDCNYMLVNQKISPEALFRHPTEIANLGKLGAPKAPNAVHTTAADFISTTLNWLINHISTLKDTIPSMGVSYAILLRSVIAAAQAFFKDYLGDKEGVMPDDHGATGGSIISAVSQRSEVHLVTSIAGAFNVGAGLIGVSMNRPLTPLIGSVEMPHGTPGVESA